MDDVVGSVLSHKTTQVEIKPNLVEEHQLPENIARYSDNGNDVDLRFDRDDQCKEYSRYLSEFRKAIANIYSDEELSEESTRVKFTLVQNEGGRRVIRTDIDHYN